MSAFTDLKGKRFGRITILSQASPRFTKSKTHKKILKRYWTGECVCGNIKDFRADSLQRKENPVISCGCLQKEKARETGKSCALPFGEKPFNDLFSRYQYCAQARKINFNLLKEDFRSLTQKNCFYCGEPPAQKIQTRTGSYFIYNGIDRINSDLDYDLDNVVTCCGKCNRAKQDLSQKDFLDLIRKIYHTHFNETSIH